MSDPRGPRPSPARKAALAMPMVDGQDEDPLAGDRPEEACGVFGIFSPGHAAAFAAYDGLFALQHRGQESAGIAVSDREEITVFKNMGLVSTVFDERSLSSLPGEIAIGHTRYSTAGDRSWQNAQPIFRTFGSHGLAVGHNGNLTNARELAEALDQEESLLPGMAPTGAKMPSDTEIITEMLARKLQEHCGQADLTTDIIGEALSSVLPRLKGAYCLIMLEESHLIAARDPRGFRPLCLGQLSDGGWVVASESPALDVIGARFIREVEPGEALVIDDSGVTSFFFSKDVPEPRLCIFEFVYFARPDARLLGREVHGTRVRMGELLAKVDPVEADLVMGVPDSGIPAAEGYARASGIPFGHGLVKNRYIGRTFINPERRDRVATLRRKLNVLTENVRGARLVVIDDSIVRGTTTGALVRLLRDAGAKEIHLRISSPPYRWPCFYGIDTPHRPDLIAANQSVSDITDILGADTLAYLPLESLHAAVGAREGLCNACLTGDYPEQPPTARVDDRVLVSLPTRGPR